MNTRVAVANAELIRKMFDAFKRGDIPFILNNLSEDCDWNASGEPLIPSGGRYIGSGVGLFFSKLNETFEFTAFEVLDVHEVSENEVISVGYMAVRSRKTGKTAQAPWVMRSRFKNGKLVYHQDYIDSAKLIVALEQSLE